MNQERRKTGLVSDYQLQNISCFPVFLIPASPQTF
jgi:hypothetical protein